jgi:putative exporter of polyketide antibiotics
VLGTVLAQAAQTWIAVALAALNVFQVVALAYIADRSRRVRASDLARGGGQKRRERDR